MLNKHTFYFSAGSIVLIGNFSAAGINESVIQAAMEAYNLTLDANVLTAEESEGFEFASECMISQYYLHYTPV